MTNTKYNPGHTPEVIASDHSTGAEHGAVVLLEFGDYTSAACSEAERLTRHLLETYGDRLRFVFRHFPLVEIHPHAELAAEAAEAAGAQGKFWQMHQLLCENWQHLKPAALTRYAQQLELDLIRFQAEMSDRIYLQRIQEHRHSGERIGLHASPAFFLNGKQVDVSFGLGHLEEAVRAALHDTHPGA